MAITPPVSMTEVSTTGFGIPVAAAINALQAGVEALQLDVQALPGRTALVLPGATGNYVSTPDHSSLDITGDLDLRWCGSFTEWVPAAIRTLIGKADNTGVQRSFYLSMSQFGRLLLNVSANGTTTAQAQATATPALSASDFFWINSTWRASDGRVQFFWSPFQDSLDEPTSWTKIGTDQTANIGALFAGTSVLEVGSRSNGDVLPHSGRVLRAIVREGINGTIVADYRGDITTTKYVDPTGKLWTVNGSATGFALGN